MRNSIDRLELVRRQLLSRVREAIDDAPPEIAESAVGRMIQAGALIDFAAGILSEELGPEIGRRMVSDLAQRASA